MKVVGYIFDESTGLVASGRDVLVRKRLPTPTTIATVTSGSDGKFQYVVTGNPGLVDFKTSDGPPYRIMFGDVSLPRHGGWSDAELGELLTTMTDGIVVGLDNELEILAPGGMFVQFSTGLCHLTTGMHRQRAAENVSVPANSSGSTRVDSCGVRMYLTGDDIWKTEKYYKSGSVTVVQDADTHEVQLATISVAHLASSISIGNITDTRTIATFPVVAIDASIIGGGLVTDMEFDQLGNIHTDMSIQDQLDLKATIVTVNGKVDDFTQYISAVFNFGNGLDVITSSEPYVILELPEALTPERWFLEADVSSTVTLNVAKAAAGSTSYSDCDGSAPLALSAVQSNNSSTLTGWTAGPWSQGDKIKITVTGTPSGCKRLSGSIRFTKARS
jgi:hypothetical protein